MEMAQTDRIAFRFTRQELGALLRLMGIPGLRGCTIEPRVPEEDEVQGLIDDGYVMLCGSKTFLDSAISLLLATADRAGSALCAECGKRQVLYVDQRLCVLLTQDERGPITLEPFPDLANAQHIFLEEAKKLEGDVLYTLWRGAEMRKGVVEGETLLEAIESLQ